ncbi:glycosyltransferase family 25 protein [Acinetobacter rathckeae]|uniref:glycosyltransferase family 25 protein n=1 Tax=Acinetobacter rathckeae TaxID=2605272 RepID=UPI0018A2FCB6|nr:glycosyltransferase family 25 protein [Acinetobacter rathckeae]MBF7696389.1 glycosyltransferase family 25 protein [Acinetobacter rathckeae]
MNCYILSLEKDFDRRNSIKEQFLLNSDGSYEFFNAIDPVKLGQYFDLERLKITNNLTIGEMCCAFSHLKIYEKILSLDGNMGIVLEDDAQIHESIHSKLSDLSKLHKVFDVVIIGYSKCDLNLATRMKYIRPGLKVYSEDAFARLPYKQWKCGTVGYSINRSGAKKILEINKELKFSSDNWEEFEKKGLKVGHYSNIFITENFYAFQSNLELERGTFRNPSYALRYLAGTVRHFALPYRYLFVRKYLK